MNNRNRSEIHTLPRGGAAAEQDDPWNLPHDEKARPAATVLGIDRDTAAWTLLGVERVTGEIRRVTDREQACAAVRVVGRRFNNVLSMRALAPGMLVNGLPALSLTALGPRDSVLFAPGVLGFVTERIRPHVGPPGAEHIGKKCPVCRLKIEAGTQIVAHRCGVAFHHETAESHPDMKDEDRLKCFTQIEKCLSCGRGVTLEESLSWDPAEVL